MNKMKLKWRALIWGFCRGMADIFEMYYRILIALFVWYGMMNWFDTVPSMGLLAVGLIFVVYPIINRFLTSYLQDMKKEKAELNSIKFEEEK